MSLPGGLPLIRQGRLGFSGWLSPRGGRAATESIRVEAFKVSPPPQICTTASPGAAWRRTGPTGQVRLVARRIAAATLEHPVRPAASRTSSRLAAGAQRAGRRKKAFRAINARKAFVSAEKQVRANACHHGWEDRMQLPFQTQDALCFSHKSYFINGLRG